MIATIGQSVTFHCTSNLRTIWKFNGGTLPGNTFTGFRQTRDTNWLIIHHVEIQNAGNYTCSGEERKYFVFEAIGMLSVTCMLVVLTNLASI